MTNRRTVLYARLSAQDGTSQSVPQQLSALRDTVARLGWPIVSELVDDGISASSFGTKARPGWQELIRLVESGQVSAVGFWEQSRLARDLGEYARFRDLCASRGVLWVTPSGTLDPSADSDRLGSAVTAIVDEAASRQTSARVKRAMRASAEAGRLHGRSMYALERRYGPTRELVGIEVVPAEAAILQRVAREILAGASLRSIAVALNAEGIPAPQAAIAARTGRPAPAGAAWSAQMLKRMLTNPIYIGQRVHKGETLPGGWEPILDEGTHRRLLDLLTDPSRDHLRGRELRHFLSGILRCSECGIALRVVNRQRGGEAYFCARSGCFKVAVQKVAIEEAISGLVLEAVRDSRFLRKADDGRLAEIRAETKALRARLDEATAEFMGNRLSAGLLGRIEAECEAGIAALQREWRTLSLPAALPDPATIAERWADLPAEQRRHITMLTVGEIIVRSANRQHGRDPIARCVFPALEIVRPAA